MDEPDFSLPEVREMWLEVLWGWARKFPQDMGTLPQDMAKVLHDNLWDLYATGEGE